MDDKSSIQEIALLACLNDNQSLKKRSNIDQLRDPVFVHSIFSDLFEQATVTHSAYPESILPVLERIKDIQDKHLLVHYIDTVKRYQQKNIQIIRVSDKEYPPALMKIPDPPFIIYVKGRLECLSKPAVAIVGTRGISHKGARTVHEVVRFFVKQGYTIVSGLALGTDACAHEAALELGGETIAVLPLDIENIVPATNQELARRISRSGALISEVTDLAKMHRGRYIERNRITSALSEAVIVVETGESGGSIRQAETAFKQGTPVYAVRPESTNMDAMAGFERLVPKGAIPIKSLQDLSI